jgi:energy-converting hydrogenase Eha subunit A
MENKTSMLAVMSMGIGAAACLWAGTALVIGLGNQNWQVSEMFRQYLVALGVIKDFDTLVDFYTHIKGVEYIICAAFLGTFPAFFKYVNKNNNTAMA